MSESDEKAPGYLEPGTVIAGKYRLDSVLGAGGMGRVYHATQLNLETGVCVKTLHAGATADPAFAARFEREARATSQLRHPNIVSVFDYGQHVDGTSYLVMELVPGLPLSRVAKKQPMPAARAIGILAQVCDALSFAHARGVIHRDLKPANIMVVDLDGQDHVKVLDFGSALMLEGDEAQRLTRAGMVLGTPTYMAPEYILGRGADARVDVYAVGVLLYVLLTGGAPFRGSTQAVFAQQISVSPERPSKRCPEARITPAMDGVVLRTLVKDPAKRFGSATELKEAMLEALAKGDAQVEVVADLDAGTPGVQLAREDRPVVMLSVETGGPPASPLHARLEQVASREGARLHPRAGGLDLVFGLDREVHDAAPVAMRLALSLQGSGAPLAIGFHDARASVRGRFGDADFEYELFGDGMAEAASLASLAGPGRVLVSGALSRHVPLGLRLRPVPGRPDSREPTFQIVDPAAETGQADIPFVGRAAEQRKLLELAVGAGEGRIAVVSGPAGMGKTRLVTELVPQADRIDVHWSVIAAQGEVGPTHPASALAALGWSRAEDLGGSTERFVVSLMLGTGPEDDDTTGERRQLQLVAAALDGVARRAERGPLVVVLDELALADDTTWVVAQRLVEMAAALSTSVVLCVRDPDDIPFTLPPDALHVALAPLSDGEVTTLAARSRTPLNASEREAVVRASLGVPLLAEELLRAAREGDPGLALRVAGGGLEETFERLARERVARLPPRARRLLEATCVLGSRPREGEARTLAELGDDYEGALSELRAPGLVARTDLGRIALRLPLLRETARAMMAPGLRRFMHARAAELLEGLGVGRSAEVGEHRLEAGDPESAFERFQAAGEHAYAEGGTVEAVAAFRRAQVAGERLDGGHEIAKADLARKLGRMLVELGELEEAEVVLREAFPLARAASDGELAADLLRIHGRVLVLQGRDAEGKGEIEAAYRYAERRELAALAAEACGDLADAQDEAGDAEAARQTLARGLGLIEGRDDDDASRVRLILYKRLGRLELDARDMDGAIAVFTQALSIAQRLRDRYQEAGLLGNLGGAYARRGHMDRALHFTERAQRASESLGDQIGVSRQSFNLALLHLGLGQGDRAEGLLRQSFQAARRAGWREGLAMSTAALAKLGRRV